MTRMTRRWKTSLQAGAFVAGIAVATLGAVPAAYAAVPANDSVSHPTVITAVPTVIKQNTSGATRPSTDPGCVGHASVWYSFTPSTTLTARVVTLGTAYDAMLAIFRGQAVNSARIACADDTFDDMQAGAQVTFQARTRYLIAVSNYWGGGGPTVLTLYRPTTLQVANVAITSAVAGKVSGYLVVTGTMRCTNPSNAAVGISVSQMAKRHVARGYAELWVSNTGVDAAIGWSATIETDTGYAFTPRLAAAMTVDVWAFDGWRSVSPTFVLYPTVTAGVGV